MPWNETNASRTASDAHREPVIVEVADASSDSLHLYGTRKVI